MTQEDKELLLKDLCARLPYGVKCSTEDSIIGILSGKANETSWVILTKENKYEAVKNIKPYFRLMSSMTEEEKKECIVLFGMCQAVEPGVGSTPWYNAPETKIELVEFTFRHTHKLIDWLNKHHFDYRGLIEKGLATEAPDGMYEKKKE